MLKALWTILGWKGLVSFLLFFTLSGAGIFGYGYLRGRDNERDRFYAVQIKLQERIEAELRERYEEAHRQALEAIQRLQERSTRTRQQRESFNEVVKANPTSDSDCPAVPSDRVREFNRAIREANAGVVPSGGDDPVR